MFKVIKLVAMLSGVFIAGFCLAAPVGNDFTAAPVADSSAPAIPSAPAADSIPSETASAPVPAMPMPSGLALNKPYSVADLLKLGFSVEAKPLMLGEKIPGGVAKAAVWKTVNNQETFFEGYATGDGSIVITQQMSAPANPTVLRSDWTSGSAQ